MTIWRELYARLSATAQYNPHIDTAYLAEKGKNVRSTLKSLADAFSAI